MNEIIKLYENAGFIQKQCKDYSCTVCEQYNKCEKYPPFTAEKQIELIKWAARIGESKVEIGYSSVYGYWVENYTDTRYYFGEQFDSALASLINSIWQDLTEEAKQQIREILK